METKEKNMSKEVLTMAQEIEIAMIKKNLVQADVVELLQGENISMNTSKFSIKKSCNGFTGEEIKALNKVLGIKLQSN